MPKTDRDLIRVLHCPHHIGGQAANIARYERAIDLKSTAVIFEDGTFGYHADETLWSANASRITQEQARWQLFARALTKFDVIHYNFGCPILNWGALDGRHRWMAAGLGGLYAQFNSAIELPLLKVAGKVIAVTYQGDDARQGDYSRQNYEVNIANEVDGSYYSKKSDEGKRRRIARFSQYADLMYSVNPDLLNVLPTWASYLPYAHIDLSSWLPVDFGNSLEIPHVVHAPSHKKAKGTAHLLAAVERLKSEGILFRFSLVEGMSNDKARCVYETADLLVDQLLAGFYGGLAVELMALGKPVICYIRESDMHYLPSKMRDEMPIIKADPVSIYDVLREWLTSRKNELKTRGIAGRKYVEKWHSPSIVASFLKNQYEAALDGKLRTQKVIAL